MKAIENSQITPWRQKTLNSEVAYGTCGIDNRETFKEINKYPYSSVRVCNANLRKAKRHNNGLHIAHDSCHLFTGPTFKKQQNIILELTVRKKCTIGLDSSAHHDSYKQQHTTYTLCMLCAAGCVAWWVGSRQDATRPKTSHMVRVG